MASVFGSYTADININVNTDDVDKEYINNSIESIKEYVDEALKKENKKTLKSAEIEEKNFYKFLFYYNERSLPNFDIDSVVSATMLFNKKTRDGFVVTASHVADDNTQGMYKMFDNDKFTFWKCSYTNNVTFEIILPEKSKLLTVTLQLIGSANIHKYLYYYGVDEIDVEIKIKNPFNEFIKVNYTPKYISIPNFWNSNEIIRIVDFYEIDENVIYTNKVLINVKANISDNKHMGICCMDMKFIEKMLNYDL